MKILITLSIFLASVTTHAYSGKEIWIATNMRGKVELLNAYKIFFAQLQESEKFSEVEVVNRNFFRLLISEAWAAPEMDCLYAGWPSKRVNNLCSSPARQNPDYQKGSCHSNQLQCQPLLFGKGLCVPVSTQEQRSLAFSNCDKKYKAKKSSPESLIKEIRADGNEKALFELMDFADNICKVGKQSKTPMCNRMLATVESLRHFKLAVATSAPETVRGPAITSPEQIRTHTVAKEPTTQQELVKTVTVATEAMNTLYEKDCEPELNGEQFDRQEPRPFEFEYTTSRTSQDGSFDYLYLKDKNSSDLRNNGFNLSNIGPNSIAGYAIDPREKTERQWSFHSEDDSRRETYLWITDDPGSGYLSDLMETVMIFVPRKMKQKIEVNGDDLHVTLTTGEKVIFDKKTKQIKAGALSEGKLDTNPNKHQRKNASVQYKGSGISIRVDSRGKDPRHAAQATISQNGKSCKVPSNLLWGKEPEDFKFSDDSTLIQFLNSRCNKMFSL